ncbi:AAA family ATPase [Bremerella sp. JC770]|uniref:AAA family ATPase n=1 Tax=Bremerella sp. JC770 TaxID=3232137 RepID=UPI0034585F7E
MSDPLKDLLSQLAGNDAAESGDVDPWQLVEAVSPEEETQMQASSDKSLEEMISRINSMTSQGSDDEGAFAEAHRSQEDASQPAGHLQEDGDMPFYPREPETLREANLTSTDVEALCLKYLLTAGEASGREIGNQLSIPFLLMDESLRKMKYDQLVVYKDTAQAGDYVYFLTDLGRERARRYNEHCTYYGAAPVSLKDYIASVRAQSLEGQSPSVAALETAFEDLLINKSMFRRLGPAINSGRGLFLFGAPGNGKTSIAERVTRAFGKYIWVPRAIGIDGEILRVFDPAVHDEVPLEDGPGIMQQHRIDRRWVRIKRPTIIVGGELTMDNLEISTVQSTGVSEAPLQLKSNCGTLVIDDFGRQRMSTDELLNRWIVPLEKRYDFLNMRGGKKIQVPFDQLIVFSTNLEPRDLCDDAFLRRIPYKIEVIDPTEHEFRQLFDIMCPLMGFTINEPAIDYLIETHYKKVNRPFRCCQPRDLLMQVRNMCLYENAPLELTNEYFDDAVDNYFAVM